MDEHNKDFEEFLRQFSLREPRPLPEASVPERNWFWAGPARRWALAAAAVALIVGISVAALRYSSGTPPTTVTVVKPGDGKGPENVPVAATDDKGQAKDKHRLVRPGEVVVEVPAPEQTAAIKRPLDETARVQRIAAREINTLKIDSDLGGSDRFLTHLITDKPIYRAGEKVYVRGVVLRAEDHVPVAASNSVVARFEIRGPKGEIVSSGASTIGDSTAAFVWDIPATQAGGEYTIRVSHPNTGDAPAVRKFEIRAYRAPRLKSQIVFVRDGYGPGDTVSANLHVDRAEGGIPVGAKVSVIARVDGVEAWKGETTVNALGNASATFKLPATIARGEGVIAMIIQDGGTSETASKTIPILLRTLDLDIYPEGGDLVAGLVNRVYVEGRTPSQKPADMAGIIVNAAGRQVAAFRTEHEGRGRFSFTPVKGESYSLRVTEPAGIQKVFPLPAVKASGVVMTAPADVIPRQQEVVVRVTSTSDGRYNVVLSQRGKEVSFKSVVLKAGLPAAVALTAPRSLDGVLAATVYDSQSKPLAERLLFRQPDRRLNVRVTADRSDYVPGDNVTLRVATTDDAGQPVGAVVGLTVTDSSVLEMIEKRAQTARLPAMVLFESDVKNLSDAHVYLDEKNPKALLATDLLLGTQGWRRFATIDPSKFVVVNGDAGRRALGIRIRPNAQTLTAALQGGYFDTVGGLPMYMINTVRDGLSVVDGFFPGGVGSNTILNPDMIAEIRLILAPVDAEAGRGNGQVQLAAAERAGQREVVEKKAELDRQQPAGMLLQNPAVVLDEAQIRALPLVGNDPLALIATLPGYRANPLGHEYDTVGGLPMYMRLNTVRQYAHARRPNWTEASRVDFAETVFWNAGIKTDGSTGVATVSFTLSDSVTSFSVLADGFAEDGRLGSAVSSIESVRPFYIEPKMPLQVTSGDVIRLPVGMINGMSRELSGAGVDLKAKDGLRVTIPNDFVSTLGAKERARRVVEIDVAGNFSGAADLTFDGKAGAYRDTVVRKLDVQPRGYPYETTKAGVLESNGSSSFDFTLPAETIRGSVSSSVVVYPTPLANMTQALEALIRQPYGCFEQTSSTSYPMVMAQQYFLTHSGVDPAIIEKAKGFLDTAYKRLIGFGSRSGGYEWFGGDPGHEALTAYGLMQFTDMAIVRDVDKDMLQRTRTWLLDRRDGKGGFSRNARALDSFGGAPQDTTNAYITWALVESGDKRLDRELAAITTLANSTSDSYILALAANTLHATGDRAGARQAMDKLVRVQESSGEVKGMRTSITQSGGQALAIEGTALSVLAWMREPAYAENVERGMRWLVQSNKNGRFSSTQATVLALRAIVAYDAAHARPKAAGQVSLVVDGKPSGAPMAFTPDTKGAIVLPEFGSELVPGRHTVALRMADGSDLPFSISVKYNTDHPDNHERAQVGIQVALRDTQIREGAITEATVSIVNKSNEAIPTPVAIVGIPGGLEVRHEQLKELVKSGTIATYEVIGREVVLYWRYLKANEKFDLPLSLVAAVPGTYTGPASRAYLYYTDEYKSWAPGLKVTVTP